MPKGLIRTQTDPRQGITTLSYDRYGVQCKSTDRAGLTIETVTDLIGRPVKSIETGPGLPGGAAAKTTLFTYTPLSLIATRTDPLVTNTDIGDATDNSTDDPPPAADATETLADRLKITNAYDDNANLITVTATDIDTTPAAATLRDTAWVTSYEYDGNNRGKSASRHQRTRRSPRRCAALSTPTETRSRSPTRTAS